LLRQHLHCTDNSNPAKASPQASFVPVLSKYERKKAKAKAKKQLRKQASSDAPQLTAVTPPAVVRQKKLLNAADISAVPSSKKRRRDDVGTKPQKLVSKVTEHPFPAGQYAVHNPTAVDVISQV
jgi:hypothetical protein